MLTFSSFFRAAIGLLLLTLLLTGCNSETAKPKARKIIQPIQMAIIADAHFSDIYGELGDHHHRGIPTHTPDGTKPALIRTMASQVRSTRLFNENYFALIATLDDIAQKGIKWVLVPGDFSDDGQPLHVKGISRLFESYEKRYGMRFLAALGNHDPVRPFSIEAGKSDFLGGDGHPLAIFSKHHHRCTGKMASQTICSDELMNWGYKEILAEMGQFGFEPTESDLYFETPFNKSQPYQYSKAKEFSKLSYRMFKQCQTAQQCVDMPDTSYLVEPIKDIWVLSIDANVYLQRDPNDSRSKDDPFVGSSNAGYNALMKTKPFVLKWIKDVVSRAEQQGKTLIAFSHFPMTDFNDEAEQELTQLFGKTKVGLKRQPTGETSRALADTGLKLHIAGHMHINDTGKAVGKTGNTLFNVQVPTLAAYVPAYKLMTVHSANQFEFETITVSSIARYNELFPHYEKEWQQLNRTNPQTAWNHEMLDVKSYLEFNQKHLEELVRLRHVPKEWPKEFAATLFQTNTLEMQQSIIQTCQLDDSQGHSKISGPIVATDFYRLRNGDKLYPLPKSHQLTYQQLSKLLEQNAVCLNTSGQSEWFKQLTLLFKSINKFASGLPSVHFEIDTQKGEIKEK